MTRISLTVDGASVSDDVEPRMLLVQYLREKLGKTGTVVGCDTSNCGACTVHLDGTSVKSCNVLAVQADGAEVTTIEGLSTHGELHPVQEAFLAARDNARAQLAMKEVPGIEVFGGIVLNKAVGGINPDAVEWMHRVYGSRGKVVWLPTFESDKHAKTFGKPDAKGIVVATGATPIALPFLPAYAAFLLITASATVFGASA